MIFNLFNLYENIYQYIVINSNISLHLFLQNYFNVWNIMEKRPWTFLSDDTNESLNQSFESVHLNKQFELIHENSLIFGTEV